MPRSAPVFLDAPNVRCVAFNQQRSLPMALRPRVDLDSIRSGLLGRLRCGPFHYVSPARPDGPRFALRRYVGLTGWRWVEAAPVTTGGNPDPVDAFIISRLNAMRAQTTRHRAMRVVLISHDADYAAPLRAFLEAGGEAVLVGLRWHMSLRLLNLTCMPRCLFLDLSDDLRAI